MTRTGKRVPVVQIAAGANCGRRRHGDHWVGIECTSQITSLVAAARAHNVCTLAVQAPRAADEGIVALEEAKLTLGLAA